MIHQLLTLGCLLAPVDGAIVDHFREPACAFCPGNRGLEYEVTTRRPVVAAAPGVVSFAGTVAGVRYVVIRHADGSRTTSGKLDEIAVRNAQTVGTGEVVGWVTSEFFFGLRIGDDYLDPEPLLARRVYRPRLLPTDGSDPRPPPPPRLACQGGVAGAGG